ncbi:MAG: hypothetical protein ACD_17C00334G0004, partial [uncultured bacterium]
MTRAQSTLVWYICPAAHPASLKEAGK